MQVKVSETLTNVEKKVTIAIVHSGFLRTRAETNVFRETQFPGDLREHGTTHQSRPHQREHVLPLVVPVE